MWKPTMGRNNASKILILMFDCRIKRDKFPKGGEIVMGRITSVSEDTVSIELLEYGNITGIAMNLEVSKKKYKNISQVAKVGNIEIATVLKVEQDKSFIDLSMKAPSDEEKRLCRENFARTKLIYQIIFKVAKLSNTSVKDIYETWGYDKEEKYGSLYAYFAKAKDNLEILNNEPHGELFKKIILEHFKASSYKVRADVEVTCSGEGISGLKRAFKVALEYDSGIEIHLLKSPTYSITKVADSKEEGFKMIEMACELIRKEILKIGGTFSVITPAQVYGEKAKHSLLDVIPEDNSETESSDE